MNNLPCSLTLARSATLLITARPETHRQDPDASYDINDDDNDPTPQDNGDNK